jgi:hypothetical protein
MGSQSLCKYESPNPASAATRCRIPPFGRFRLSRYLQKISLRPYSDAEIWTGWELEGRSGPVDGLIEADSLSPEQLEEYGVTEFQTIPAEYLDSGGEFRPRH